MSILADHQIRQLCTLPTFVIQTNIPQQSNGGMSFILPRPFGSFSYLSEEEIKEQISNNLKNHQDKAFASGIVDYRPLTQEEKDSFKPMISPFMDKQVRIDEQGNKVISYGLGSYGYDLRISDEFKIFSNINSLIVDPKNFDDKSFVDHKGPYCIIPPNSFALARTVEYFNMPRDVSGVVLGKSTLARIGISCLATPAEAGWSGELVLEFANTTPLPAKIYAWEGAAQMLFFRGEPCEVSYADRSGKYQGQTGITTAKV